MGRAPTGPARAGRHGGDHRRRPARLGADRPQEPPGRPGQRAEGGLGPGAHRRQLRGDPAGGLRPPGPSHRPGLGRARRARLTSAPASPRRPRAGSARRRPARRRRGRRRARRAPRTSAPRRWNTSGRPEGVMTTSVRRPSPGCEPTLGVPARDEPVDDPRGCRRGHPECPGGLDRPHRCVHEVAQRVQLRHRQPGSARDLVGRLGRRRRRAPAGRRGRRTSGTPAPPPQVRRNLRRVCVRARGVPNIAHLLSNFVNHR